MRSLKVQDIDVFTDDGDYDMVTKYNWHIHKCGYSYYVRRNERIKGQKNKWKTIYLHRLIMNVLSNIDVDHINGDTLDNRKCNLRVCSRSENVKAMHDRRKQNELV